MSATEPASRSPQSSSARRRGGAAFGLAGTVGELGQTIDETKPDLKRRAKKVAPIVGGVVAAASRCRLVIKHR